MKSKNERPLSDRQVEFFKENGFLVLESFIEESTIEIWRKRMWDFLEARPDRPETWDSEKYAISGFEFDPPDSAFGHLPQMRAVLEQLGEGEFQGGGGSPIIQWPREGEWQIAESGHIDGYGPGGWSPFMFGATTYLYDVEPQGGGFTYWPGSHLTTWEYFLDHPKEIDGSFGGEGRPGQKIFSDLSPSGPVVFDAPAGDVVLWHSFLCHTGSPNIRSFPRMALFARYSHKLREEIKWEIPEDLWKYWAI